MQARGIEFILSLGFGILKFHTAHVLPALNFKI